MLQRIQTIWLFLTVVVAALLFFLPIAEIVSAGANYKLIYRGIYPTAGEAPEMVLRSVPLAALNLITVILGLVSIFLFKKRQLQMRFCMYNSILFIANTGLIAYYAFYSMPESSTTLGVASALPIVGFILSLIARKSISKDDKLVKSLDRIR